MSEQIFLDTAIKIGDRLVKTALWDDGECTWNVMAPDRADRSSKTAVKELADEGVYQGASGIALFLIELYRLTNDAKIRDCILGTLSYAYKKGKDLPDHSFGFHSGRVGIAYALFNAGKALSNDQLHNKALEIIKPLNGKEEKDFGIDVIGGAGGAIQPLLSMYEHINDKSILELARNLGDNLIKIANMEPVGFSWGSSETDYRRLCGYAHGAAGIGHALLELYNVTGDGKYLFAFEQSVEYENQFYSQDNLNWPDFRYSDLSEFIYENRIDELKEVLKQNNLPPYQFKYMNAWCHGSPGIALNRLRALELLGKEEYKSDAMNAIEGTIRSLTDTHRQNYSLCHGLGGNCEALIIGSKLFDNSDYIDKAKDIALKGIESFEEKGTPWLCGTMGSVSDPSLLLGEAGIGYYLLRLHSADVPSVLAITTEKNFNRKLEPDNSYQEIKNEYTSKYFGNTIKGLGKLFNYEIFTKNFISETYELINDFIEGLGEVDKKLAFDLFIPEQKRYLNTIDLSDFSIEYKENLIKKDVSEIKWDDTKISLNKNAELIECKFEWDEWFQNSNGQNVKPKEDENYKIVYRLSNKVHCNPISAFTAIIFDSVNHHNSAAEITEKVSTFFDKGSVKKEELKEKIILQLKEFYKAGYIRIQ